MRDAANDNRHLGKDFSTSWLGSRSVQVMKTFALALLLLLVSAAQANDDLIGIHSLYVTVEELSHEAKLANLTRVSLETLVEDKLKQTGIPVQSKGPTGLQVIVSAMEIKPKSMVYDCTLNLQEMSRPASRSINAYNDPVLSSTWTRSRLGVTPRQRFPGEVQGCVRALLERFLQEYAQANPKNPSREVSSQ